MAGYYMGFQGKKPGTYLSWHKCSKQIIGVRNSIHKKNAIYEQAVAAYQTSLRDFNAPVLATHPLPPDLSHVDVLQGIPPADGKAAG
jgi:hypothetical protein